MSKHEKRALLAFAKWSRSESTWLSEKDWFVATELLPGFPLLDEDAAVAESLAYSNGLEPRGKR